MHFWTKEIPRDGLGVPIFHGKAGVLGKVKIDPLGPARKWANRMGRVYDIWATPCDNLNPGIWVDAFFSATPTLFLTPIKPSQLDYLIIRIGFGSHGKKRRKFFDIWDFEQLEKVSRAGRYTVFFPWLARWGAMALWYIVIADAVTGFAVNWVSGAYQLAGCLTPGTTYGYFTASPGLITPVREPEVFSMWVVDQKAGFIGENLGEIIAPRGMDSMVSATLDYAPFPPHPGTKPPGVEIRAMNSSGSWEKVGNPGSAVKSGSTWVASASSGSTGTRGFTRFMVVMTPGDYWWQVAGGYLSYTARSSFENVKPDP